MEPGCSYYDNDEGTKTYIVTGGWSGNLGPLNSTELLVETASAWVYTGELPSPRYRLGGANIDNRVFMTGGLYSDGTDEEFFDEILEFDPLTGQWKVVAKMMKARSVHAVSVINFESGLCGLLTRSDFDDSKKDKKPKRKNKI